VFAFLLGAKHDVQSSHFFNYSFRATVVNKQRVFHARSISHKQIRIYQPPVRTTV